ncbi:hypothetical protein GCM10017556_57050 [Micromonospora sagamiensis]|nr:hypothetical protein GCM10017556_57050 [Micromonospora sagamiensis]
MVGFDAGRMRGARADPGGPSGPPPRECGLPESWVFPTGEPPGRPFWARVIRVMNADKEGAASVVGEWAGRGTATPVTGPSGVSEESKCGST